MPNGDLVLSKGSLTRRCKLAFALSTIPVFRDNDSCSLASSKQGLDDTSELLVNKPSDSSTLWSMNLSSFEDLPKVLEPGLSSARFDVS